MCVGGGGGFIHDTYKNVNARSYFILTLGQTIDNISLVPSPLPAAICGRKWAGDETKIIYTT